MRGAKQTHPPGLNAAIEAARAADHEGALLETKRVYCHTVYGALHRVTLAPALREAEPISINIPNQLAMMLNLML